MEKVLIIGAFAFDTMDTGGQPVKTRELFDALKSTICGDKVVSIDTVGWKKHPLKLLVEFYRKASNAENIIMLPAQKGVLVFSKLLISAKKKYSCKIYYDVIGGWLPEKTKKNKSLRNHLTQFDGIWVESDTMKRELNKQGMCNVQVIRNFKSIQPISIAELNEIESKKKCSTLKTCTFSRVSKEKGIEDAINAVKIINTRLGAGSVCLDIFGQVDHDYADQFDSLKNRFPEFIKYGGVITQTEIVTTLKKYDVLLFPTFYPGEGLAGTLIDSFASGLPIIATNWRYNNEFVKAGKTGFLVDINNPEQISDALYIIYNNPTLLYNLRMNCLAEFEKYSKHNVINKIISILK